MRNLLLFTVWAYVVGCSSYNSDPIKTGYEGMDLPSFELLLTDSLTTFNTGSIPTGRPILLFDFGPDCPYSKAQVEEILVEMENLKNIRFYLFTPWPFQKMKNFYEEHKLYRYSNIVVGSDHKNFFGEYFHIESVPYIAIYNEKRKLNEVYVGRINSKTIIKAANQQLK